eukprot:TRINITY_DN687_c0_g1_i2.p1 TRINITY_DN687_c0_g1~~TRINITY_DN687_c0_g1_i2.p1  ORF type:complete len:145 (-),score=23.11 TRINITY_DN687_c0_g1_i2:974-1408(-)
MARRTVLRFMCTVSTVQENNLSLKCLDSLDVSAHKAARKLETAIQAARMATKVAAQDGSDHTERTEAIVKVKHAVSQYRKLAALGSPPVVLSEFGSAPIDENQQPIQPCENDVTRLFDEDVQAMKKEIFDSNKQRVWIGWRGWF